ncbi:hypothetical protein FEM08_02980 [Flavobacterium gilvum]|nr:hypothetical protein FEM08_35560 [Flavobacterium gilvum]KFC60908.1 hypothetical protein FEM08_02980 [Flavobacterium gilvum]
MFFKYYRLFFIQVAKLLPNHFKNIHLYWFTMPIINQRLKNVKREPEQLPFFIFLFFM